ncbi:hypothetical protein HHK36_006907 [Tetracentron sinense]|uniref:Uncharacterized protein n=1 Tax=Tetracentron sinense TaxID=13715 RepID=A0A834ZIU7_TETSI|nr:hypothetical protein HHK36_006907 [Tetracentron sinense]
MRESKRTIPSQRRDGYLILLPLPGFGGLHHCRFLHAIGIRKFSSGGEEAGTNWAFSSSSSSEPPDYYTFSTGTLSSLNMV